MSHHSTYFVTVSFVKSAKIIGNKIFFIFTPSLPEETGFFYLKKKEKK